MRFCVSVAVCGVFQLQLPIISMLTSRNYPKMRFLLDLPLEIRDMIVDQVLLDGDTVVIAAKQSKAFSDASFELGRKGRVC